MFLLFMCYTVISVIGCFILGISSYLENAEHLFFLGLGIAVGGLFLMIVDTIVSAILYKRNKKERQELE